MKVQGLSARLGMTIVMFFACSNAFAQGVTKPPTGTGSVGLGIGVPYGVVGVGGEYPVSRNINLSAGIGTTVLAGAGYSLGVKYYLKDVQNTWRPRVSAYYGTNAVLQVAFGRQSAEEKYTGLTLGVGQRWMFGKSKRHGLDLDILYVLTSGIFDDANQLEAAGIQAQGLNRIKLSIGYRFGF